MIKMTDLPFMTVRINPKSYAGCYSPSPVSTEKLENGVFAFGIEDGEAEKRRLVKNAPGKYGVFLTKNTFFANISEIDIDYAYYITHKDNTAKKETLPDNMYSVTDIVNTLSAYQEKTSEEAFEAILYFVSDLTGLSIDKLNELTNN